MSSPRPPPVLRPLLSSSSSSLSSPHPSSPRTLLRPSTGNLLLWIPLFALACLLISVIHTALQLEDHLLAREQLSLSSPPPLLSSLSSAPFRFLRQADQTSSVRLFGLGNGMLRQPVVSPPHEHNLGQAELDQSSKEVHDPNSGASAGQIKPKKRRPLIRSPSRDKLIKLLLQQPRGAGMEDRSGGTGHEHEHAQSHERPKQSDMANHKKDGLGIPAEAAALAASASASAAADSLVVIPLIVFTFNRAPNLKQTMDSLLLHRPEGKTHLNPIFISQDGDDEATRSVAMGFVNNLGADPKLNDIHYLNFHWETSGVQVEQQHMMWTTYYKIATHYGFALTQVLDGGIKALPDVEGSVAAPSPAPGAPAGSSSSPSPAAAGNGNHYDHVILIEDDMEVSLDFYSYFRRTRRILDSDPSLLCVSAWNDNGRRALVGRPEQLYRSECFPGLGWMINRRVWDELKSSWAKGFWDDWLREPKQRKGRSCVFPEMNRVFTFGEKGSSAGQFYDQYLRGIILNSSPIRWDSEPLDYLSSKQNYRRFLWEKISRAKEIAAAEIEGQSAVRQGEFRIRYENTQQLDSILQNLNMMTDHKAGIPRTSFEGVLSFTKHEQLNRFWLVPSKSKYAEREWREESE